LDPAAFAALMGQEHAAMVFTDPPFNLRIDGHVGGLGAIHHRSFPMASGEMDPAEFAAFLDQVCANLAAFSLDGSLHFSCMDWRHIEELLAAGRAVYTEVKNLCVWVKDNGGMGSLYRSQYELVFVFKYGRDCHRNNVQLGRFGRNRSNVWHYPGGNPSLAPARKATSWRCTRPSNRWRWSPMRSSTARPAATSCSTRFSAAAQL